MKITALKVWPVTMKLREPYRISYGAYETATNVLLKITTNKGIIGFGCAAPDFQVTGETPAGIMKIFSDTMAQHLQNANPLRYAAILEKFKPLLPGHPSAVAMVDMALHDILGKKTGLPLYQLLGGFRTRIKTSITIGIMPLEEAVEKAVSLVSQGFQALKLKGGHNVEEDIERVKKIRETVGRKIALRFDANQGYSESDIHRFVDNTTDTDIELIEQPTRWDDFKLLGRITRNIPVPVMADESLKGLRDAFRMAKKGLVDMVNIKLMKVGGINEAFKINAVARAAGFNVMVGCMDETALSIAAGLHFALARPNVLYADLDGHMDLIGDPTAGVVILKNGVLYPNGKPGLGFDLHIGP